MRALVPSNRKRREGEREKERVTHTFFLRKRDEKDKKSNGRYSSVSHFLSR